MPHKPSQNGSLLQLVALQMKYYMYYYYQVNTASTIGAAPNGSVATLQQGQRQLVMLVDFGAVAIAGRWPLYSSPHKTS